MSSRSLAALLLLLPLTSAIANAQAPDRKGVEFFETKIRPVLVRHCYKCHSKESKEVKGGLLLDNREASRMGGESGHAVIPGDLENSLLIQAIKYETFEMPPKEQLPEEVIADFVTWVKMGAPDPRDGQATLIRREIDFEEGRRFWAFQAPVKHSPPKLENSGWPRSDLDRFVLAKLETAGVQPVGDASRQVLLRRIYFDLIGVPPTPDELAAFRQDQRPNALERVVDRLLDSPQFGERWGRHWLDVARYAESNGRERNFLFPHAWRYRDYVIDSFNKDKPFDQFVREQIAGDLLNDGKAGDEQKTATGFLAIGPKSLNERNREKFRMDVVDEQIDVSTRAVMALTVSCARCHDHKFDPIPTAEYYGLAGIFRSTNTLYGTGGRGSRQASKLISLSTEKEAAPPIKSNDAEIKEKAVELRKLQAEIRELQGAAKKKGKKKGKNKKAKGKKVRDKAKDASTKSELTPAQRSKRLKQLRGKLKRGNAELKQLRGGGGGPEPQNAAMGVAEGNVENCRIYIRGEVDSPGEESPRGYLTILSPAAAPRVESQQSGRLELANWLTAEDNPLTARVFVNRVWQHLFGAGLVATVDNFGATGELPSHPELLDHLAVQFMEDGWSTKRLVRRIVLSRSYQLSSDFDRGNYEKDPLNRLVWRMSTRRLDAESLRDAMLLASGRLKLEPPTASIVAKYKSTVGVGRGLNADQIDRPNNHRSVYLPILRNAVPEALRVFDFAEPSIIVGQREVTTVPAQALYLMNNEFVMTLSEEMAGRLLSDTSLTEETRVARAYQIALSRDPSQSEQGKALDYLKQTIENMEDDLADDARQRRALAILCQALFATAEFRYLD